VKEAIDYQVLGVCLPPYWIKKANRDLGNSKVQLVTVVGFPLGYHRSEVKAREVESALRDGADEIDVVVNLSAVKNRAYHWIKIEMAQLAKITHQAEKMLKVIIETAYLNKEEMQKVCQVCVDAGVDFIKTSTGLAPKGAQLEEVRFLRSILPESVGIKASGGIRSFAQAQAFVEAGAERIGASAAINIIKEANAASGT
ncbi:MAG: deoxyribose-phosphate aldolase, partial [Bacteroidota bacterium]